MRWPWVRREPKYPPGLTIEEMHLAKDQSITLSLKYPGIQALGEAIAEFFVAEKGINFVTMTLWTEKLGYVNVEFRREDGKPLAQVLGELRAKNAQLREQLSSAGAST